MKNKLQIENEYIINRMKESIQKYQTVVSEIVDQNNMRKTLRINNEGDKYTFNMLGFKSKIESEKSLYKFLDENGYKLSGLRCSEPLEIKTKREQLIEILSEKF